MATTRIVCTIGPATESPEAILALHRAGMNVARLNASHNNLDWHAKIIRRLHELVPDVPVLLDIPGRKIRTAVLAFEPTFASGETIILTTEAGHDGSKKVSVGHDSLHLAVSKGDKILADDGTLHFTVVGVEGRDILCRAENGGQLKSRKGINIPHVALQGDLVTERDNHMVKFARENAVDYIGISFVDSAAHVEAVRALVGGNTPRIVSKVENRAGLEKLEEIAAATDAIMIDRGDLSVETSLKDVALMQKRILDAGRRHSKPVIVATEMLHSMIDNPFPTKAEVSDITHAVLDGCAATMLSGETAVGAYPIEAVRLMREVCDAAELHSQELLDKPTARIADAVPEAMADAAALICRSLPLSKIVVFTQTGYAARQLAARRPRQKIIAVSDDEGICRAFNLIAGTEAHHISATFSRTTTNHIAEGLEELWRRGILVDQDTILVTGRSYPRSGNRMNLLEVHRVADLVETLGWRKRA